MKLIMRTLSTLLYLLISTLEYTNWEGGIENIGCVSTKCSEYSGLAINPKSGFTWNAFDKGTALPYICVSKCPVNFKWYPGKKQFSNWPLLASLDLNGKDDIFKTCHICLTFRSQKMFDDSEEQG